MMARSFLQRRLWLSMAAILLVVTAAIGAMVGLMYRTFDDSIAPQVLEKAGTAGRSLGGLIGQAAAHDIAIERLIGVDDLFADTIRRHPEVAGVTLQAAGRAPVAVGRADAAGGLTARLPVPGYEAAAATLSVSIDPGYVRKLFAEMALDLLVVAVVTLFVSLELLYFLAGGVVTDVGALRARLAALSRGAFFAMPAPAQLGRALSAALDARVAQLTAQHDKFRTAIGQRFAARHQQRGAAGAAQRADLRGALAALRQLHTRFRFSDAREGRRATAATDPALVLGAMRAPFFLLLLADDLSRSFMPLYAAGLAIGPVPVPPNLVASLPIVTFMLVVALSQPVLGGWSERIGRRRSFLAGAALSVCAHLLSAQADNLPALLVWRAAGGAAWAIAFVAAQGYILDHTDGKTRTAGLAAFVGIIMVSLVCGPPIGGILADGIGHRGTLLVAACLTSIGLFMAWRRLPRDAIAAAPAAPVPAQSLHLALAFTNRRFLLLLLLAAVPAKLILIAYCFYLIPLYVVGLGSTSAMAGRMIMLYSVMMVLLVPVMADWVVGLRARHARAPEARFVAAGLALSGLAGLAMALPLGLFSPLLLVLLLGVGQALSISPQAAMVAEVCRDEIRTLGQSAVYGIYRMGERFGNALGPLLAAALLEWAGFQTAFVAIGAALLLCAAAFALVFLRPPPGAPVAQALGAD